MTSRLRSVSFQRRFVAGLAATLTICALGFTTPAAGAPVLDANCPDGVGGTITFGGDTRIAQTFTTQTTGSLVMGQIKINKSGTAGNYRMDVNATDGAGVPTNTVLASAVILDATVPPGVSTITGAFAPPAQVTAGQQYALVITRPGSNILTVFFRSGDPCPGGSEFASASQTGGWTSVGMGNDDVVFATLVEPSPPPEPEPQPEAKANRTLTLDANKNKVKKGRNVTLSGQVNEIVRQGPCESGQTVQLQRKKPSQATFATVEQLQTDAAGSFSAKEKARKTYEYRAQVAETAICGQGLSNTEKVKVKKPK
jgi:hypothetical protein